MSNREPESILQKQKQDQIEIEEFYTNVREKEAKNKYGVKFEIFILEIPWIRFELEPPC